ncbi:DUF4145 domain-containing protein [Pseudonocardia sp.]|uniref:DUF4145 domain-containing protein n=1 Tax=Pseudonocardia sp. TaxID=60912 RepID=UPI003D0FFC5A
MFFDGPNGRTPDHFQQVSILTCGGCHNNVIVVEDKYTGGQLSRDRPGGGLIEWRGIHWWPSPGMNASDPDVAAAVADAIAEGTRCLAVQAPRAAVVMYRGALAEIVQDKGSASAKGANSLCAQLKRMADEGDLDKTIFEWASEVRVVGNAGAHPSTMDAVSQDEAAELLRLIRSITEYLYVNPARVRRARSARGASGPGMS